LDHPDAASQQDLTTITETFVKIILSFQVLPISHMNDPRSKHDFNLDNFSLLKGVRRPDHLDALRDYILKTKNGCKVLLNNDDGNVNSTLLLKLAL
jgi:hypothetical protein